MKRKDLLSISDLAPDDIRDIIEDAIEMKRNGSRLVLAGKTLALLFEKPSLRTKVSFDVAMHQLGGHSVYLSRDEIGLGSRESITDAARTFSRYVDIIAARTFAHDTVKSLAEKASIPVINALSDMEHPCQAVADILTIYEIKKGLEGLTVAYVGDGNNVANSLLLACMLVGITFRIASPPGYQVSDDMVGLAKRLSRGGAEIVMLEKPGEAVENAGVVYTDVWTSMGQEEEAQRRREIFSAYQVNEELLAGAAADVIFMHPLPAHHGEEVAPGIIDSPQSVVFDQAENRLHVQKAILARLLRKS